MGEKCARMWVYLWLAMLIAHHGCEAQVYIFYREHYVNIDAETLGVLRNKHHVTVMDKKTGQTKSYQGNEQANINVHDLIKQIQSSSSAGSNLQGTTIDSVIDSLDSEYLDQNFWTSKAEVQH